MNGRDIGQVQITLLAQEVDRVGEGRVGDDRVQFHLLLRHLEELGVGWGVGLDRVQTGDSELGVRGFDEDLGSAGRQGHTAAQQNLGDTQWRCQRRAQCYREYSVWGLSFFVGLM